MLPAPPAPCDAPRVQVMLTRTHLIIITTHASGGTLFEYIQEMGRLSEEAARFFFRQLITAVEAIHASGLFHRDLKLENALVDIAEGQDIRLQLSGFGASKHVSLDSSLKSGTQWGALLVTSLQSFMGRKALQEFMVQLYVSHSAASDHFLRSDRRADQAAVRLIGQLIKIRVNGASQSTASHKGWATTISQ